jgi:uncharacterized protein (DUF952 family)
MSHIYHITTAPEWLAAKTSGSYQSVSLKEEGYIHCCEDRQVNDVLHRYFNEKKDLVKLTIETEKLTSPLIYDWSPSLEDTFPHIYGPINTGAVIEVTAL